MRQFYEWAIDDIKERWPNAVVAFFLIDDGRLEAASIGFNGKHAAIVLGEVDSPLHLKPNRTQILKKELDNVATFIRSST